MHERVVLIDVSVGRDPAHPTERILRKFPFRIGRRVHDSRRGKSRLPRWQDRILRDSAESIRQENDLYIDEASAPYHVSRNHLEIGFDDGKLYFRDVGSALGTIVNGKRIGGKREPEVLVAEQPENEITLGKRTSPWRFRVVLPTARRRRLLIADDEEPVRNLLRRVFQTDFDIVEAQDGAEALRLCLNQPPDLALLDWMMPEIEGVKVCKTLKSDLRTANVPVIMVTGLGLVVDKVTGIEAGADDYVTKPVDITELKARVAAVLSRSNRARDVHWLTGIASESAFRDEVDTALSEGDATGDKSELLLVRIHGIGDVQHAHGPETADRLQKEIARTLLDQSVQAQRAVVGHLGRDTWGITVCSDDGRRMAAEVKDAVQDACSGTPARVEVKRRAMSGCRNYHDLIAKL